jgi:2-polyprenyl-3-methyl-5-hydroxy-6-metoxy-1,4-benzoquinol methylase
VVAVDESPEMVARVPETETICSTIGELRLDRRFDLVLMMSYLINVADETERVRLLRTCAHHVRPGGSVLIQQQIPGMLRGPAVRENGNRRFVISDVEDRPGNIQAATLSHTVGDRTWSQRILTQNLAEDQLTAQLTEAGLTLTDYLTPDRTWVRAHLS